MQNNVNLFHGTSSALNLKLHDFRREDRAWKICYTSLTAFEALTDSFLFFFLQTIRQSSSSKINVVSLQSHVCDSLLLKGIETWLIDRKQRVFINGQHLSLLRQWEAYHKVSFLFRYFSSLLQARLSQNSSVINSLNSLSPWVSNIFPFD